MSSSYINHCLHESFAPQMTVFWVCFRSYLVEWCEYLKAKHILKNYKISFLYMFSLLVCCCLFFFVWVFAVVYGVFSFSFLDWAQLWNKLCFQSPNNTHTQKSLTCAGIFLLVPHVFSKGCKNNEVANLYFAYYKYVTFNLKYNLMWSYFKWLFRFPFTTAHMKTNMI